MSLLPDRSARLPRQERRAQLLEAAREAFVQQGYHAAGMDDIAELAGVSKPVLYQHFPGKLELYLAVLDESSDSLIDRVRKALESTHDNRKRVRATFEAYFDFVAHESGSFRLVFESDLTNVPAVVSRVARTNETCAEMIAEVIREDTQLDDDTSMLLASGLLGMAQTSARRWLHSPTTISQSDAARAMAGLAWRGISGFPLTSGSPAPGPAATAGSDAAVPPSRTGGTAGGAGKPDSAATTRSRGKASRTRRAAAPGAASKTTGTPAT
jgi:AcrR family transcriptional regulator